MSLVTFFIYLILLALFVYAYRSDNFKAKVFSVVLLINLILFNIFIMSSFDAFVNMHDIYFEPDDSYASGFLRDVFGWGDYTLLSLLFFVILSVLTWLKRHRITHKFFGFITYLIEKI